MVLSLHKTAISSRESSAGARPRAASCRQTSSVTAGSLPAAGSPRASSSRAWLAERMGPCASGTSWPAPSRGKASALMLLPWVSRAFWYSTPKMQLGFSKRAAASAPTSRAAVRCRRTAKDRAVSSSRNARENPGESSTSASSLSRGASPSSLPKKRVSTFPRPFAKATPPAAKRSAPAMAQGRGSSSTRSAPLARASLVLAHLSRMAGSPRWT